MKNKAIDNAKVGLFVLAGVLFLVLTLYSIGRNKNLLGSTFTIKAVVSNVNGLVPGNNVRFKGIDVGTVKSISIENDTAIYITLYIDHDMKPYIKKNAIASIGTDGLMGNKLLNINSMPGTSASVEEGDIIHSRKPIETDDMLRTLNTTNNNIANITRNLYEITNKLNSSNSLWTLLSDTVITKDLKNAVVEFKLAGSNAADITQTGKNIAVRFERGNGLVQQLFTDTTLSNELTNSLEQIRQASNETSVMMNDLKKVIEHMKEGEGAAGLILSDTLLRENLIKSGANIEQGTYRFNQNMEALKSNFLFRGYFKKLEREQKKNVKASKK